MNVNSELKGDVYVVISESRVHPVALQMNGDGFVFACRSQKDSFPEDVTPEDPLYNCGLSRELCSTIGYYDVVHNAPHGRTLSLHANSKPIGVFIPRGVSKKKVADDLRRRFGAGTILLKPDPSFVAEPCRSP
ncbi:MAG: hypothetical protein NT077_03930 [Candidatus Taylorbacteria bacterium]|nr:hypothetical protein [Candidatus Taylorbacteria bacterium]